MKKHISITLFAIFSLTACTTRGEQVMIQNAKSSVYSSGYTDGCESGRHDAGVQEAVARQDQEMYKTNKTYKKSWDTGYKECKFREERVAKLNYE